MGRDPYEEKGGLNLFSFVKNNAVVGYDVLGRDPIVSIDGNNYEVTPIPRVLFSSSKLPAGDRYTYNPGDWGLSFGIFFSASNVGVVVNPLDYVYVAVPTNAPVNTVTTKNPSPSTPATPPKPTGTSTAPAHSNIGGENASDIDATPVVAFLITEVALPSSKLFVSEDDSKKAEQALASELYNRINGVPVPYKQTQIDGGIVTTDYAMLLGADDPKQFAGFSFNSSGGIALDPSVQSRVAQIVDLANNGGPNIYSDLINEAEGIWHDLYYYNKDPGDPFGELGGTYGNRQQGSSEPGGSYKFVGTLGGNDFYTILDDQMAPPPKPLPIHHPLRE